MTSLQLPAPAKLNLYLHITGRRPDGYHELDTLFQFVGLADQLTFTLQASDEITVTPALPGIPPQANLVWRAARLLYSLCSEPPPGVHIQLHKQIPSGGGLGGGSSDAATTLLALNQLWQLRLPLTRLQQLGLQLGADVPVFIQGQAARALGVGEHLTPASPAEAWYLIVNPGVAVSTAEVFQHPELPRQSPPWKGAADTWLAARNDCQELVTRLYPQVAKALSWLLHYGPTRMTGTGASLFTLFASRQQAQQALAALPSTWQGVVTQGRNQSPVHQLLANGEY